MAFNSNKNTRNKVNTTTKIIQLYNETAGEDSGTMSLGFWNNYATININPILPKSEQVDGKVFNYDKTASTLLSVDNLFQIQTGIRLLERDDKLEKDGKSRKINSIASKSNNVVIKIGGAGEYDGIDSKYIALFSLNDNNTVDGSAFYVFTAPESGLLLNYNEDNNSSKNRTVNTQWEQFKTFIDYAVTNLINGGSHGSNKDVDYQCSKIGSISETTKALVENLMGNSGSSNSNSGSKNSNSGFAGSRRRRSSITLSDDDIEGDDQSSFVENDSDEEEVPINTNRTKSSSKGGKKRTTTSSNSGNSKKKSNKRISVEDIEADMNGELDDMSDID